MSPALRREIELNAWKQPLATLRLYRLFPEVIDRDGLNVTLVAARLRSGAQGRTR